MQQQKDKAAWQKAGNTDRWTEILFRALTSRVARRWRFVSFRGVAGGEWCGVVDVLAIRKDTSKPPHEPLKRGDLFDIVLVQMKGGSSRPPSARDLQRLQAVKEHYRAKEIVLFEWCRGKTCGFKRLTDAGWSPASSKEIFG